MVFPLKYIIIIVVISYTIYLLTEMKMKKTKKKIKMATKIILKLMKN